MSDHQEKHPNQPRLVINGHEATEQEYKRIFRTPAPQTPRKDETATRPLHNVVQGFQLLK